jgi:transcriptional regulator with XRE-family HTH domain
MEISKRIQEVADFYGLNLSGLANKTGLSRTTLHSYVSGSKNRPPSKPPADVISVIAEHFPEVNARWLLTGEGVMVSSTFDSTIEDIKNSIINESNVDYKEKYYELTEKVIYLQDELNVSRLDLINCLKAKINMPVHLKAQQERVIKDLLG